MSIIRVKKDKRYFAASNEPFNDTRLSWEARGLMGYLLSKPDDWKVMFNDLVSQGPAGDHKVRRILKELQALGYLERKRVNKGQGQFEWESTIFENSTISRLSIDGSSIDGSSIDGKPRDILSTELTNTKNTKNGKEEVEESWTPTPISILSTAFVNKTGTPELTGGAQRWNEAILEMVKMEILPEDIENAVDVLLSKNYTIVGPWSVKNAANYAKMKRLNPGSGKKTVSTSLNDPNFFENLRKELENEEK